MTQAQAWSPCAQVAAGLPPACLNFAHALRLRPALQAGQGEQGSWPVPAPSVGAQPQPLRKQRDMWPTQKAKSP